MFAYILLITIAMAHATSPPKIDPPSPGATHCPNDKSLDGLDMKKMLGEWHVVEVSMSPFLGLGPIQVKPISGQTITFTEDSGVHHLSYSVGRGSQKYKIVPEGHEINSNLGNEMKVAVAVTDYEHVALIVTCEQMFTISRVARVLLRTNFEDNQKYIDQAHEKLSEYGFDVKNMGKVDF
ncbi:hypothetical protein RI129_012626 [Pyrocoelia pectoralis]|uniref:Lipocalin/cytosolic fatty-acid binding domain-containing protein n=1 Tax=Pyrocoelia pectoralis TaxID=417401 RepID=A0AAN7ZF36_9COLE